MKQNLIVCAAMKMKDGLIVHGVGHYSSDMTAILERIYGEDAYLQVEEQGFIDRYGEFINRADAWTIADTAGQIRRPTGFERELYRSREACVGDDGVLLSENLY